MGSHVHDCYSKLPIIEFNQENLTPGTSCWKSTSDLVRQALESHGCFVVSCDQEKMSLKQHEMMFDLATELFRLPLETKMKHVSEFPVFGYGGNIVQMPLFESFGIEDGGTLEAAKHFTTLMWPNGHDKFCESLYLYSKLLLELDHVVLKLVCSSYGLEKYYDPLIESSMYMTRIIKYRSPKQNERNIGLVPHRDKGFLAVVGTNQVKGLEIETRNGNWIEFDPSPSKFIVAAGEPLMAWSNGRIYCPLHRVIARENEEKYSICSFSFVGGILKVPEELVDDQNPLQFKPFSNLGYVDHCKDGSLLQGGIKKYCGISEKEIN